jgi:hypothetical protein
MFRFPFGLVTQLFEQRLGLLQVGGVEALSEPVVDFGEYRTRFVTVADSPNKYIAPLTPSCFASGPSAQPQVSRSATIPISPEATGSTAQARKPGDRCTRVEIVVMAFGALHG